MKASSSGPFVYGLKSEINMETLQWEYAPDLDKVQPLRFFCSGDDYEFWGLFPATFHLFCPAEGGTAFLLGTDRLGRDQFSGLVYGARLSLTIGLVGVTISIVLGLFFGGIAGYFGGIADTLIQRLIEIMRSLPELPLWMALSAALPVTWSPVWVYFGLTIILGLLDWPGLARAVRSKASVSPRRRIRQGGGDDGGQAKAGHHASPSARLHQPHHCLGQPVDPGNDPWRDGSVIPQSRTSTTGHLLGRSSERGAKHFRRNRLSLADGTGDPDHHCGFGLQFPR
jgi:hypothetical protein